MSVPQRHKSVGRAEIIFVLLASLFVFVIMGGLATLNPCNVAWLLADNDFAAHYLGWEYFRHTPLWQYPLGANPQCGLEIASSIIFTDSIPLMAFAFRTVNALLPEPFQYFGLWLLLCCLLQTYFALHLAGELTADRINASLIALFFLIAPIFIWRSACHISLTTHWLLLCGLWFFLRPRFARNAWIILMAVAAMIHIYFLPMLGALLLADVIRRSIDHTETPRALIPTCIAAPVIAIALLAVAGVFTIPVQGLRLTQAKWFSVSLASIIDPNDRFSTILPNLPIYDPYSEGFAFLGIGVIVLAIIAIFAIIVAQMRRPNRPRQRFRAHIVLLAILAILFTLIALSSNVRLFRKDILIYSWGPFDAISEMFRAIGRMFWLPYYIIYIGIFAVLCHTLQRRALSVLVAMMLILQLYDSRNAFVLCVEKHKTKTWQSPMQDPFWEQAALRYTKVRVVPPSSSSEPPWKELAQYACSHHMGINSFYFARSDENRLALEDKRMIQVIEGQSAFDPDALYVVTHSNPMIWKLMKERASQNDTIREIDGFRIVAPGANSTTESLESKEER